MAREEKPGKEKRKWSMGFREDVQSAESWGLAKKKNWGENLVVLRKKEKRIGIVGKRGPGTSGGKKGLIRDALGGKSHVKRKGRGSNEQGISHRKKTHEHMDRDNASEGGG